MKNRIFKSFLAASMLTSMLIGVALPAGLALADPYITISNSGSNGITVSVSNASYASPVDLVYVQAGSSLPTVISNIATTGYSGYWNGNISLNDYGIPAGSQVYVRVGGFQSNVLDYNYGYNTGCGYYGCAGGLTLSPSSLNLSTGQSSTVTISSGVYMQTFPPYISNNTNPGVASAYVSNYQMTVTGISNGTTSITVCLSGGSTCGSLYVTVSGSVAGANTNVWFSPSSPTMYVGQSLAVSINSSSYSTSYYGSNAYYISSNSNPSAVSASVSGAVLNLYAYHQNGTANISVCHSSLSHCSTLYVTVYGSGSNNSVSFSDNNININVGQARYITVYNNGSTASNFYIFSNSNPSAVSASVSGNQLYLYGQNTGSATLNVCLSSYSGSCATIYIGVGNSSYGNITFSPANSNLSIGQSATVGVYGGSSSNYYISSNSKSDIVTASVSGNNVYLYGRAYGTSTITVCQSGHSSCGTLYVTVGYNGYYGSLTLSQTSLNLSPYQSAAVTVYGNGNYFISSNSSPTVASAAVSGNSVNIYAYSSGTTTINVCQNHNSQCATLQVAVSGFPSGDVRILNTALPVMTIGQYYSYQLNASGGVPPYTFTVNSGGLPAGLNLSSNGLLSGVPQYAIPVNFSVKVMDSQNRSGITSFTISGSGTSSGGGVLGASVYKSGQLIKENGTVYIVYRNLKTGFTSASAFRGFGFSFGNVVEAGSSNLADSGYTISFSSASHPWGSWIKSGKTVYFVHETGLIPVPDWNTFLNNGGQANYIVNANVYDMRLPIQSPMVYNDSRLQ